MKDNIKTKDGKFYGHVKSVSVRNEFSHLTTDTYEYTIAGERKPNYHREFEIDQFGHIIYETEDDQLNDKRIHIKRYYDGNELIKEIEVVFCGFYSQYDEEDNYDDEEENDDDENKYVFFEDHYKITVSIYKYGENKHLTNIRHYSFDEKDYMYDSFSDVFEEYEEHDYSEDEPYYQMLSEYENDVMTKKTIYRNSVIESETVYEYDENKLLVKETKFKKAEIESQSLFEYDERQNVHIIINFISRYDSNSNKFNLEENGRTIFTYDNDSNLIKKEEVWHYDFMTSVKVYEWSDFDEKGNARKYTNHDYKSTYTYSYQYYD